MHPHIYFLMNLLLIGLASYAPPIDNDSPLAGCYGAGIPDSALLSLRGKEPCPSRAFKRFSPSLNLISSKLRPGPSIITVLEMHA